MVLEFPVHKTYGHQGALLDIACLFVVGSRPIASVGNSHAGSASQSLNVTSIWVGGSMSRYSRPFA